MSSYKIETQTDIVIARRQFIIILKIKMLVIMLFQVAGQEICIPFRYSGDEGDKPEIY